MVFVFEVIRQLHVACFEKGVAQGEGAVFACVKRFCRVSNAWVQNSHSTYRAKRIAQNVT